MYRTYMTRYIWTGWMSRVGKEKKWKSKYTNYLFTLILQRHEISSYSKDIIIIIWWLGCRIVKYALTSWCIWSFRRRSSSLCCFLLFFLLLLLFVSLSSSTWILVGDDGMVEWLLLASCCGCGFGCDRICSICWAACWNKLMVRCSDFIKSDA